MWIWDSEAGNRRTVISGSEQDIYSLALSIDGRLVVAGSEDGKVMIGDTNKGEWVSLLEGHTGKVSSVAISEDGSCIMSGGGFSDRIAKIWDIKSGVCISALEKETNRIKFAAFDYEGKYLAAADSDRTIQVRDLKTGELVGSLTGIENELSSIAVSSDGNYVVAGCGYVDSGDNDDALALVWDVKTGECKKVLSGHRGYLKKVAVSKDGSFIITVDNDKVYPIKKWDMESGKLSGIFKTLNYMAVTCLEISAGGRYVVTGNYDGSIYVWDAVSCECKQVIKAHEREVSSLAISSDESFFVSGSKDNVIKHWSVSTGEPIRSLQVYARDQCLTPVITYIHVSSSGRYVVTVSSESIVELWNLQTGKNTFLDFTLRLEKGRVLSALIEETNGYIIVTRKDGSVKYYGLPGGRLLATFYNISEGFAWSTPENTASCSGWFWTSKPDLIRVYKFDEASGQHLLLPVGDAEREEYIRSHNRQELVMNRLRLCNTTKYLITDNYQDFLELFEGILDNKPDDLFAVTSCLYALRMLGKSLKAATLGAGWLDKYQPNDAFLNQLGLAFHECTLSETAAEFFLQALELNSGELDYAINYLDAMIEDVRYEAAIDFAERWIEEGKETDWRFLDLLKTARESNVKRYEL
ncbi:MAG: WD40 repeat domain-containing protein [Desulfitobacteriaceae bacterium]